MSLPLFDGHEEDKPHARARATDPDTSHEAAAKVDVTRGMAIVYAWLKEHGPAMHWQITEGCGHLLAGSGPRGRTRNLVDAGMARKLDVKGKTPNGRSSYYWDIIREP